MTPVGWKEGKISDVITALEAGVSVNGEDRQRLSSEKGVLKVISKKEQLSRAKTNPKAGQIIISHSNTEEYVGASAYIEKDYESFDLKIIRFTNEQIMKEKEAELNTLENYTRCRKQ